jgi:hypothetical protein
MGMNNERCYRVETMSHRGYVIKGGRPDVWGRRNQPLLTRVEAWQYVQEVRNNPGREFTHVYQQGNLTPVYSE